MYVMEIEAAVISQNNYLVQTHFSYITFQMVINTNIHHVLENKQEADVNAYLEGSSQSQLWMYNNLSCMCAFVMTQVECANQPPTWPSKQNVTILKMCL